MGAEGDHLRRSSAEPSFPFFPIDPTTPGTEVTILEEGVSVLNPLFKFTLSLQLFIGGHPWFFFFGDCERGGRGEEQRASKEERILDEIPAGEFHGDILLKDENLFNICVSSIKTTFSGK
jgi:hypothetical protein